MSGSSLLGQQIGAYQILARLGAGGMGEVYRARDVKLRREVAIKVLPASVADDPDRRARFEREARLLAALSHPNIAVIYGLEEVGDVHALVLELVEGATLSNLMAAARRSGTGGLSQAAALTIARQMADALAAAHAKGVIHRDLKPANIMVQGGWADSIMRGKTTPRVQSPRPADEIHVKVLDFGLAKVFVDDHPGLDLSHTPTITQSATREGLIVGTPAYMSPEQARGQPLDKRTDVWSFGCVLYELLTARVAFGGETLSDTLAAILEREPDWTLLPAATHSSVQRLLQRCLKKDPTRRLHDIADARIELDEAFTPRGSGGGIFDWVSRMFKS